MNREIRPECQSLEEALSAYLDGESTAEEKIAVEEHLKKCPYCRAELEDLKTTKALVGDLKRTEAPSLLWSRIETEIQRKKVVPFRRKVSRFAASAAAAVAIFFTSVTLIGYFSPEPIAPPENPYMASHAYHLMRLPLTDHASWSFVSGEAGFVSVSDEE